LRSLSKGDLERNLEIGDDILDVLDADGNADEIWGDT